MSIYGSRDNESVVKKKATNNRLLPKKIYNQPGFLRQKPPFRFLYTNIYETESFEIWTDKVQQFRFRYGEFTNILYQGVILSQRNSIKCLLLWDVL